MTDAELDLFLQEATEQLKSKQDSLRTHYGIGNFPKYWFDQETGKLEFKDAGGIVRLEANVVILGSYSRKSGTWRWAWANESVLEAQRKKSEKINELGVAAGIDMFNIATLKADEVTGWEITAMAVRLLGALGCYRMPIEGIQVFLAIETFGGLLN